MRTVSRRHVVSDRRVMPLASGASMSSNAFAAVQNLDSVACDPSFDLLTNEAMRDALIMSVDFDVVINVDPAFAEGRNLVPLRW
jgi:hypothetical protein